MVTKAAVHPRRRGSTRPPGRTDGGRPSRSDLRRDFAELLLAALTGRRPAASLIRLVSPEVYDTVWAIVEAGTLRPGVGRWRVVACHHCVPAAGVVEVSAVVGNARRMRALAFRLESREGGRWRCTALETA